MITPQSIVTATVAYYGTTQTTLTGPGRTADACRQRAAGYAAAEIIGGMAKNAIGQAFGRDASSAINGLEMVSNDRTGELTDAAQAIATAARHGVVDWVQLVPFATTRNTSAFRRAQ